MTLPAPKPFDPAMTGYLRDESRRTGRADSVSFPRRREDVRDLVRACWREGCPVTVQGARTGIVAGAVPEGGRVLNLEKMNRITGLRRSVDGTFYLQAQPGVTLSCVQTLLVTLDFDTAGWSASSLETLEALRASRAQFFPPDPTEPSASLGGMAAANASGARSFFYGPTRPYIERLEVVLADGRVIETARGAPRAVGRSFRLEAADGSAIEGRLPGYAWPAVKNAAGYYVADDMDLMDLFIGAEGTLGVITALELRLLPAPAHAWGMAVFLPTEAAVTAMVHRLRSAPASSRRPVALEYFDAAALALLRRRAAEGLAGDVPSLPEQARALLYIEWHGDDGEALGLALEHAAGLLVAWGGREEDTWLADTPAELQRLKHLRHAVPESINQTIDERRKRDESLVKLGTDMAVPDARLEHVLALYRDGVAQAGLEAILFGHIGDNHLHVNILPRHAGDLQRGRELYHSWARTVAAWGGSVSAEHGIGKSKVPLLETMFGSRAVGEMRALKRLLDPRGILNPGNLLSREACGVNRRRQSRPS